MRRGKREKMPSYGGYKYKSRGARADLLQIPVALVRTQPSRRYLPFALWMNDYVCRVNKSRVAGRESVELPRLQISFTRARRKNGSPVIS